MARRYDASRAGRRLATQLWRAGISLQPAAWRCAQVLVIVPAVTILAAFGVAPLVAVGMAVSASRTGGALLLRIRRTCGAQALDRAAPWLARALATELSSSGSGTLAVIRAAERCALSTSIAAAARPVLDAAAMRVRLAGEPGDSLRRAVHSAAGVRPGAPIAMVCATFALHAPDSVATAAALERLAGTLEDDESVRRHVRASVGDVRMSAVAVPAVAAVTGAVMLSSDPPALAAALTPPLLPLLGAAVLLIAAVSAWVRRLVAL